MLDTFIFDLDGTLLDINQHRFISEYFRLLALKFDALGYDKAYILGAMSKGTSAMLKNNGKRTNEAVFWDVFSKSIEGEMEMFKTEFEKFYQTDYDKIKTLAKVNADAVKSIELLKSKGYQIIIATNPVFPAIATYKRVGWAGLKVEDFSLITTYENSSYSKPNLKYYQDVLNKIKRQPTNCIMVGNDVGDDMCVSKLKMNTFLILDNLINGDDRDISFYQQGNFADLYAYIETLPSLVKIV